VVYEITAYSKTLKNVLNELKLWGTQHRDMIRQSMRTKEIVPRKAVYFNAET